MQKNKIILVVVLLLSLVPAYATQYESNRVMNEQEINEWIYESNEYDLVETQYLQKTNINSFSNTPVKKIYVHTELEKETIVKNRPYDNSTIIIILKKNTSVGIIGEDNGFYLIDFKNNGLRYRGFISVDDISFDKKA